MRLPSFLLILIFTLGAGCRAKTEDKRMSPPLLLPELVNLVKKSPGSDKKRKNIPCFVYHRFGESKYSSTNISTDVFRKQLQFLKANNYRVLTLGDALELLRPGGRVPEKMVVITVDDGYQSFLTGAMPLLREFKYSATLFINTETVGAPGYMDWAGLNKVREEGIEIGNHTHSHAFFLNNRGPEMEERFKADVKKAQRLIRENLGITSSLFAYPYGEFNGVMKEAIRSLGFKAAAAQNSGVIYEGSDLFALPRFPMGGAYATLKGFKEKVAMKALAVEVKEPPGRLITAYKKPTLQIIVRDDAVDLSRVNCFVQGNNSCILTRENNTFTIQPERPLKNRRTLFTVTAPSKDNTSWHWYSYLWIQPGVR